MIRAAHGEVSRRNDRKREHAVDRFPGRSPPTACRSSARLHDFPVSSSLPVTVHSASRSRPLPRSSLLPRSLTGQRQHASAAPASSLPAYKERACRRAAPSIFGFAVYCVLGAAFARSWLRTRIGCDDARDRCEKRTLVPETLADFVKLAALVKNPFLVPALDRDDGDNFWYKRDLGGKAA